METCWASGQSPGFNYFFNFNFQKTRDELLDITNGFSDQMAEWNRSNAIISHMCLNERSV